ncbi:MAG TPA: thiamine pyrophosphate-dependent enzyme, partial [Pyrinomonadaceae bacterium]|nr:thiamine pyrophosphate-dependent enzyme [Pyrinomonadaceae bacterium]
MSSQTTDRRQRVSASAASVIDAAMDRTDERSGLRASPAGQFQEDRKTLVDLLHQMLLIRRFEEKSAESYSLGKIGGFCHLYIGQEAVGVGAISAVRRDDYVITSYREHGQALAKGISADAVMAELFGKSGGCSHGKGGSMHLFDKSVNFLGGHAIVGAQIPLATGVAFASKYKETDRVTLC